MSSRAPCLHNAVQHHHPITVCGWRDLEHHTARHHTAVVHFWRPAVTVWLVGHDTAVVQFWRLVVWLVGHHTAVVFVQFWRPAVNGVAGRTYDTTKLLCLSRSGGLLSLVWVVGPRTPHSCCICPVPRTRHSCCTCPVLEAGRHCVGGRT